MNCSIRRCTNTALPDNIKNSRVSKCPHYIDFPKYLCDGCMTLLEFKLEEIRKKIEKPKEEINEI